MILPGLCSITFRQLRPDEIIALAAANGLAAVEWGGDLHVPAGDVNTASAIGRRSRCVGLRTPSYGSYFRVTPASTPETFAPVIDTANALGAETIRVWADSQPSGHMDDAYWQRLIDSSQRLAEGAACAGCRVGFEYHLGTATDTNEGARRLIEGIAHPAARLYWQPRQKTTAAQRLESLRQTLPDLAHLHVFQWVGEQDERRPMAEGRADWRQYLACVAEAKEERYAYLEFVADDSTEAFARDAATLRSLLAEL